MAFLFKSKKSQDRTLTSRDGTSGSQGSIQSAGGRVARDETHRATPTGSLNSIENDAGSPDVQSRGAGHRRGGSLEQAPGDGAYRNGPPVSNPNAALYPWTQRRLTYTSAHPSPFPRYGAAVNSMSSKEGDIYMMGGLINSSTVKGDLWMIEAGGNMACYPLATTAEGPGPRVGHASLLVGNAFIVYGGDTKIDESDVLDETLYLLNTSTRQWSRALPAGPRPSGRYGHTLNILGSKIYIFGGQVEGYFMNDLSAFDLNQLQMPNNRWEVLLQGETSQKMPAARTNHSMITHNDKMYLFGGTNGFQWFNDVWCFDPAVNKWTNLDCIGYIPAPREGHAASLVDDVMYIFGGRTEDGADLGDLAAFKISSKRWYTFQNMGPSPSPRSGHSMTTVGRSIVVLGGEPSSASAAINDLGILYVLDTTKIRYPTDGQQKTPQGRRPSAEGAGPVARQYPPRDGSNGPQDSRQVIGVPNAPSGMSSPQNGQRSPPPNGVETHGPAGALAAGSKLPRATGPSGPTGPPPQVAAPPKPIVDTSGPARIRGASVDRNPASGSPVVASTQSPAAREVSAEAEAFQGAGRRTPTQTVTRSDSGSRRDPSGVDAARMKQTRSARSQGSLDNTADITKQAAMTPRPSSPPPPTRQPSNPLSRRSSGRNSQTVALLKELDSARNRNAWYASELELARKGGYVSSAALNAGTIDSSSLEAFDDEDRPLIEALLSMRSELANVQSAVDKQAVLASKQIAEAEKQRDAAIQEAVYAKAKLAAQLGAGNAPSQLESDQDNSGSRATGMSRKLGSALQLQKDLEARLESMKTELASEKKARQLADETFNAAQSRMSDLEAYKQQTSAEVERLKAELHATQREARQHSVNLAETTSALELLKVEKEDFATKYNEASNTSREHNDTFASLRSAVAASQDARSHLQTKLEEERTQREDLEAKFNKLRGDYEARTAELATVSQRLRDAEEIAEKHATEARTHREAVIAGLDKISARDGPKAAGVDTERTQVLQKQVEAANALVKKYQQEANLASDKLRSAEERIAGLEQYQEQSSREGVSIRRQLQAALRDTQSLQAGNTDLKNQLAAQQLDANAMSIQHNALKDILAERGISPTAGVKSRGLTTPQTQSPDLNRVRELESQLASATAASEEAKQALAVQAQESETTYREKLSQLENDYQSAVHYVKGTEKMLKQLKDQLARYKTENSRLKTEVSDLEDRLQSEDGGNSVPSDWETERSGLHARIGALEEQLHNSGAELQRNLEGLKEQLAESERQRDDALKSNESSSKSLDAHRKDLEQLKSENFLLEQRANDAEQKVSLLLDQVEHSVDSYRRQSRQVPSMNSDLNTAANGTAGHTRNESSEAGSAYGGNGLDARNSAALDNLASELESLRSHWEATSSNYRLSTNFEFDSHAVNRKDEDAAGAGLSESLADWRKRLDADEHQGADKTRQN